MNNQTAVAAEDKQASSEVHAGPLALLVARSLDVAHLVGSCLVVMTILAVGCSSHHGSISTIDDHELTTALGTYGEQREVETCAAQDARATDASSSHRTPTAGSRTVWVPCEADKRIASGCGDLSLHLVPEGDIDAPMLLSEMPPDEGGEPTSTETESSAQEGGSLEDINNKLNNPGADITNLNFKLTWNQFEGDLGGGRRPRLRDFRLGQPLRNLRRLSRWRGGEGASSQDSLALNFQPVFPFKLDDRGSNFLVRPSFPLVWQPSFNADNGGFDEEFGLGDMQLVMFYANTNKDTGFFWGAGPTMQMPTHTDDSLGTNQFQMGPAAYAGFLGKWGTVGVFPQHWWNVGGSDEGYTSFTALQAFYWFSVGHGWQVGGAPIITYDWAADDSDQAWTVPVNLGLAKTIKVGNTPVKLKLEGIYYIVQPDAFGPHWGLQLTVTPVIPNPFAGLLGRR